MGTENSPYELLEGSGQQGSKSDSHSEEHRHIIFQSTSQIWRNVIAICFGFMFLFTSFQSLSFLQSSLFREDGMGTTILAVIYGSLVVSTFFIPSPLISFLGCKFSMAIAMSCYIFYSVAHFYATWAVFTPAAIILGLGAAPLWTAKGQYLNLAAHDYAKKKGISNDAATNLFFGIFFLFFQTTSIWGNLISSQVLSPRHENSSLITPLSPEELNRCGHNFDPRLEDTRNNTNLEEPPHEKLYMLAGIYTGCACVAVVVIVTLLQQLPTERGQLLKCRRQNCEASTVVATFLHLRDYRQLLLIPITMYSGLEQAFLAGDFTQAFVTCPLGSWWVGYVIICYGVLDACCSLLFGKLVEYVGRAPFFILAAVINSSLIITFLHFDARQDRVYIYFIFAGLWGVSDAVWQTQINALYGVLFKDNGKAAFCNYRLWESTGFIISFVYQSRLPFAYKAYILLAVLILGIIGYGVVECLERRKKVRRVVTFLNNRASGNASRLESTPISEMQMTHSFNA